MKRMRIPILVLAVLGAAALARGAVADTVPFPSSHAGDIFVTAQTVTTDGVMSSFFTPGSTVVFRSYAVDGKTRKILTAKDVIYYYVTIPNQPNVKLKNNAAAPGASGQFVWTGTWTVPTTYPTGRVAFKVLVKSKAKRTGSFVQIPVLPSQLNISAIPVIPSGPGPAGGAAASGKVDTVIYADSVNGTGPKGAAPRPVGCTQTNVYKRGEQFVLRSWGFDLTARAVFSTDNVSEAHFTVPGQPNVILNWGSHGAQKVFFWTNFWNIPTDYPLGNTVVHISFTLTSGKVAALDYPIVIIP